ncbi:MAG TPA: hypothetical protein VL335_01270 [Candidatus Paceibacterota bacterium]|jgi:hypothetical protein|nr:hypothetical protein [Candidatus Paceibacterota bacterium]
MKTKSTAHSGLRPLSLAKQAEIELKWNKRLGDPLAFIPVEEKRKGLDPTEARKANERFGRFATTYLKKVMSYLTTEKDLWRRRRYRKKILAVGYGRGYDTQWLSKAAKIGLQTTWVDVFGLPYSMWASTELTNQLRAMPSSLQKNMEPEMVTFEIQSLLAEPKKAKLDLSSVEIWYLSRLLNCLSTSSAKAVLQEIGRLTLSQHTNPSGRGAVIIINALSDQNPNSTDGCCDRTSIRRSKKMILCNLARGAGCPVEARFLRYYDFFGKYVTAMTVMAK